ncbi:MAG: hypothetical protein QM541_08290 [Flavobacterium sp.]|nr:hypothetical protein [Flavobacterium sp.]
MISNSRDIKEKIALLLNERLKQNGFVYKKTSNEFIISENDCIFIFNMLLTAWSDHYSLGVRLYISQKKVEKIYEDILGKSHKLTIGNSIERISKSSDGREVINGDMVILLIQDEDLEAAVETLERYYNDIAKPYFEQYQTLDAINDIMNNPPFEYCPAHVGGNFDDRCMKGLIVARLVDNPNYEHLVAIYDEAIKETMNTKSIENYYRVREYLMYNRIK